MIGYTRYCTSEAVREEPHAYILHPSREGAGGAPRIRFSGLATMELVGIRERPVLIGFDFVARIISIKGLKKRRAGSRRLRIRTYNSNGKKVVAMAEISCAIALRAFGIYPPKGTRGRYLVTKTGAGILKIHLNKPTQSRRELRAFPKQERS